MTIILNIALASLALVLGILAIGGETWDSTKSTLWQKITRKGWLCVFLLLSTFVVGVSKELVDKAAAERLKTANQGLRDDLADAILKEH